jgi:hypothetical protein
MPPRSPLLLSESAFREIKDFLDKSEAFETVTNNAHAFAPAPGLTALTRRIARQTGVPYQDARRILSFLWNLKSLQEYDGSSAHEFINRFTEVVRRNEHRVLSGTDLIKWDQLADRLSQWLATDPDRGAIAISAKAADLAHVHQNNFRSVRIITDARPVFDTGGTRILATVITHSLVITYNKDTEIHIAVDAEDIADIKAQCERAQVKIQTLAESVQRMGVPALVFPDQSEEL